MLLQDSLRKEAFLVLYRAGWSDTATSRVLHADKKTISSWREAAGLPKNPLRASKINETRALEMHSAGATDGEIAREMGVFVSAVFQWRARRGLPRNADPSSPHDPAAVRKAKKMLKQGATVHQVSATTGIGVTRVQGLRNALAGEPGLRPRGVVRQPSSKKGTSLKLYERVARAIGTRIDNPYKEDAIAALYLDVIEGRLSADFIEKRAASYRNAALGDAGSKFGARSLDEEIGDDGFSMMDILEDPDALVSMEEAAEYAYDNDDW